MKPRRLIFHPTPLFGHTLRCGVPMVLGFMVFVSGIDAQAGDLLRGGAGAAGGGKPRSGAQGGAPTPAATDAARANARDTLAKTTRTLQSIRDMQAAARQAAIKGQVKPGQSQGITLPKVPNGLGTGGLMPTGGSTKPFSWVGAKNPTQASKNGKVTVTIEQTQQQALLKWDSFNVGKKTTLNFDQSAGGADAGKWIAFNKVSDPSANPTQILGNIKADGQVYIINPNGVIFGGSSQVSARNLTVSSLPINDNLINQGLLNNRDSQFLFSALSMPGGSDGTPSFDPGAAPAGGYGDVIVEKGAVLKSPSNGGGNGGRVMLVGPNVYNAGTISTEAGQTILAAGLQVAVAAHDASDPSLRGLDVWVGEVGEAGNIINSGVIDAQVGSVSMTGKNIRQEGAIDSTTSVSLNGRIDIKASYGAVSNPNFDNSSAQGAGGPSFLNQFTGTVVMGEGSVTRILPDYSNDSVVPGTELPERSAVNIEGLSVHFGEGSVVLAPNGEVDVRAGRWTYRDVNGDRTIFDDAGNVEAFLASNYTGRNQRFLRDAGQIYVDTGATISVAGSVDVFVPLEQSLLAIRLLGAELADSPLQRDTSLRGQTLVVDINDTGDFGGKFWVGTPLGDVTGLAGLIQRNVAQLTVTGGNITLGAGESVVVRNGSKIDVSGGYVRHEGGKDNTTSLIKDGRLVAMGEATPDQVYDGVFDGSTTFTSEKWGISQTFATPLFTGKTRESRIEGAAGGQLSISAASMAIDGDMRGATVNGPDQRNSPPVASTLKLNFEAERTFISPGGTPNFLTHSPTPPAIQFTNEPPDINTPDFFLCEEGPIPLPDDRIQNVFLTPEILGENGFGSLEIVNPDGTITVPEGVSLATAPRGSLKFSAANIDISGSLQASGGSLDFTVFNLSPSAISEYLILTPPPTEAYPLPAAGRGVFTLGRDAVLSTAGTFTDESRNLSDTPIVTAGGRIQIRSFSANLEQGSMIDASGSAYVSPRGSVSYGNAGEISILTGNDPGFNGVTGGTLSLGATLRGFSGAKGGSLSVQAGLVRIGGAVTSGALNLTPEFFSTGGFSRFNLTGIGAASDAPPPPGLLESYEPGVLIAANSQIRPVITSLVARDSGEGGFVLENTVLEQGLRNPVSLSFTALGNDDPFTLEKLEIRGDIVMEAGASILTDPAASVSFKAGTIALLGDVTAPGGSISVTGGSSFPLTALQRNGVSRPFATVHIGDGSTLSTAGATVRKLDNFGRDSGPVLAGGIISISGNIVAEKGAILDASGTSAILNLDPALLPSEEGQTSFSQSGLTAGVLKTDGVLTRVDSNGGLIDLTGSQFLLSDATLLAHAGGDTAHGGKLSISSGRYYNVGEVSTGADINLVVFQCGDAILDPGAKIGIGSSFSDPADSTYGLMGHFSLCRFEKGGFDSLDLGGKYVASGGSVPYGGNIRFEGEIDLAVASHLRLAAGGVISTSERVSITSSYLHVGQNFRDPAHPLDIDFPFQISPSPTTPLHQFAPTFGTGTLSLQADLVDLGTLSTLEIGQTQITAEGGDIRGNGIVSVAGEITLTAAQIYPTTLSSFSVFAYDHANGQGKVAIESSGKPSGVPLSAGGSINIQASNILQNGVLRAPLGSITLGWDGTDLDPLDEDIDAPANIVTGSTIAAPVTKSLILGSASLTSVSGKGDGSQADLLAPFGINTDGQTWIDPRGLNITLAGLPSKSVTFTAESVRMQQGATVDIRGGGDLLASRWVPGSGGSVDLLGAPSGAWSQGTEYDAGSLVTYNGESWSARVSHSGQTPSIGLYWTKVAPSFAILPSVALGFSPANPFNTGSNAAFLDGDPGFVRNGLTIGDTVTLEGSASLAGGTYVLLPSRYALLPGAFLLTPRSGGLLNGSALTSEGSHIVKGYYGNEFSSDDFSATRSLFEIASPKVYQQRAAYEIYTGNKFLSAAADGQEGTTPQRLPWDAGSAVFHGNSDLRLAGILKTQSPGIGANVDISSFANIQLVGGDEAPPAGAVSLSTSLLNSWAPESLLVGGVRRKDAAGQSTLELRTSSLMFETSCEALTASDVILGSKNSLTVNEGSSLQAVSEGAYSADSLHLAGEGVLIRASADREAVVTRSALDGSGTASIQIGSQVELSGASLMIDSSANSRFASDVRLQSDNLTISSGIISVVLSGSAPESSPEGTSYLSLQGGTLASALQSDRVTLRSYQTIDLYGSGTLGTFQTKSLNLVSSGLRGQTEGGSVLLNARSILLDNASGSRSLSPATGGSGTLQANAGTIRLGSNAFEVSGYDQTTLFASQSLLVEGTGSFSTTGNLEIQAPLITGASGSSYSILAANDVTLGNNSDLAPKLPDQLGAQLSITGANIFTDANILLPAGRLALNAMAGDVQINGGTLSVAGIAKNFNGLVRYAGAGNILLSSEKGGVIVSEGSTLSVAGTSGGGNAGTLEVRAPEGFFSVLGKLEGSASTQASTGNFKLDTGFFDVRGSASFAEISEKLASGGFTNSIDLRAQSGSVTIASNIRANHFSLAADDGDILVVGKINASGTTGGSISLAARGDLTIGNGALLSVAAEKFNSAGKGGSILLEAGTQQNGVANTASVLEIQTGSTLDLSVKEYVAGSYLEPGSSAFEGKFTGTLHLRTPRTTAGNDLGISYLGGNIIGASSVVAEGFSVYTPAGGIMDTALRDQIHADATTFLGAPGVSSFNETSIRSRLLGGLPDASAIDPLLVIVPGVEIVNPDGDLTLGLANGITGSTDPQAQAAADWDLSSFRYGSRSAPGVLTLRASGDLVFNNTLSDGFSPIEVGSAQTFAGNGHSQMWLATLMGISDSLPVNAQSWSYRLTAGADTAASGFRSVLPASQLDAGKGSVLIGEFYPAVPNSTSSGSNAGIGVDGQTADSIRISSTNTDLGTRFEVVRTGTGNITISAGRDVQLRNSFASVYTAGVALPDPSSIFTEGDFVLPTLPTSSNRHPSQATSGGTLGAVQQLYPAAWSMAGGDIQLAAVENIGRYTLVDGVLTVDSSRQMPTNWLYRRGYVDSDTGNFATDSGFGDDPSTDNPFNLNDASPSTTWWIDYSNFFQSVGTLGGGNISLTAGKDVINMDAAAPTNARMAGRMLNPEYGIVFDAPQYINVAPDAARMLELGGGDISINAGRNIDGGVYYAERGTGDLNAGGAILTNAARSASLGILDGSEPLDPLTWLPTTLFVGKASFNVTALGDVLLGPVSNPFLLPQGVNNKFWYKTYFSTYAPNSGVNVLSLGGDVTHRTKINPAGSSSPISILNQWFSTQNFFNGVGSAFNASNFQPWLRLAELNIGTFNTVFNLFAPNLSSTSLAGDIKLAGDITLAPSARGNLELVAAGGIVGLNPVGEGALNGQTIQTWTASTINLSDASPRAIPGILNPLAYQQEAGRNQAEQTLSGIDILAEVSRALTETGSFTGDAGTQRVKASLHDSRILHAGDLNPVNILAQSGDISGVKLFTPKPTRIIAGRDITDIAFYLQNLGADDISLVSAGRDIIPFNENSSLRAIADNLSTGNYIGDTPSATAVGGTIKALAGDIRISGPGVLEVLAGRNLDLGVGPNLADGTGSGISTIGNQRNPFLPFGGADVIALAGITAEGGEGPALGLSQSSLQMESFIAEYLADPEKFASDYWNKVDRDTDFDDLSAEQQAIVGLEKFFRVLRDTGRKAATTGEYDAGYDAIEALFGKTKPSGEVLTRSREIRTINGGSISLAVAGGGITMDSEIIGSPLIPPGIVTEFGGGISTFTDQSVDIGQARIFSLRGGDIIMWSSKGNIAAGSAPRTVVTAPPTRVVFDTSSASVQTDLGGLATGGGIGVLAAVEGVKPGNVDLIAPEGFVDAGDAGIRVTGNLNIAAQVVINAGNISAGGTTTGSAVSAPAAPSVSAVSNASAASAATTTSVAQPQAETTEAPPAPPAEVASNFTVEVIGYGGGAADEEEDEEEADEAQEQPAGGVDPQ